VFLTGTNFTVLVCVVFLFATSTALYAAKIGYHSNGCCAAKPVIVPVRTGGGSLSPFIYTKYFSFMTGTMKNATGAQGASNATPDSAKTVSATPQNYRGKYIYLKGRYNSAMREIDTQRSSYAMLLAEYRALERDMRWEKRLREFFQKENHYLLMR
jgi:hypothetical protein